MVFLTPGVMGGIFLMLGGFSVYKGNIFISTILFGIADIFFAILAIQSGDIFGGITVFVGMLFGLLTFLKMKSGKFVKTLTV